MRLNAMRIQPAEATQIVWPRLQAFLHKRGESGYPEEVVQKIAELLRSEGRDRSGTFSSSNAGYCPRQQEFAFLGAKKDGMWDTRTLNIFDDGNWRHMRIQAAGLAEGFLEDVEFPVTWGKYLQRGTLDGIGVVPDDHPKEEWRGETYGFELKGVNIWSYNKCIADDEPMDKHLQQVARYFILTGYKLFVVMYENKGTQEYKEWVLTPDDPLIKKHLDDQKTEVEKLYESIATKTMLPMLDECEKASKKNVKGPAVWTQCPYGGKDGLCVRTTTFPEKANPDYEQSVLGTAYRS